MTRTEMDAQNVRRRVLPRGLLVLSVVLVGTAAFAAPALASEGLSGYTHTETAKQETKPTSSTTAPTPAQETKPSTSSTTPAQSTEPAKEVAPATSSSTTPSTTTSQASSSTLPFTGLDLRWVVGFGLLMLAGGASIVLVQRRQRRRSR